MSTKQDIIRGKAYVVGDNIDTDQIIPAQYLNLVPTIPEEYAKLGSYAFAGLPEDCPPFVAEGKQQSEYTFVIAGRNFGCGSSREHAPIALGAAGIKAVIAESYARIFFRNAVATGELFPLECSVRLCEAVKNGAELELDLSGPKLVHVESGKQFDLNPLGAVAPIVKAGGVFEYARSTGMVECPQRS